MYIFQSLVSLSLFKSNFSSFPASIALSIFTFLFRTFPLFPSPYTHSHSEYCTSINCLFLWRMIMCTVIMNMTNRTDHSCDHITALGIVYIYASFFYPSVNPEDVHMWMLEVNYFILFLNVGAYYMHIIIKGSWSVMDDWHIFRCWSST